MWFSWIILDRCSRYCFQSLSDLAKNGPGNLPGFKLTDTQKRVKYEYE